MQAGTTTVTSVASAHAAPRDRNPIDAVWPNDLQVKQVDAPHLFVPRRASADRPVGGCDLRFPNPASTSCCGRSPRRASPHDDPTGNIPSTAPAISTLHPACSPHCDPVSFASALHSGAG